MTKQSDAGTGRNLRARYDRVVTAEFAAQPMTAGAALFTAVDLAGLPDTVGRYIPLISEAMASVLARSASGNSRENLDPRSTDDTGPCHAFLQLR